MFCGPLFSAVAKWPAIEGAGAVLVATRNNEDFSPAAKLSVPHQDPLPELARGRLAATKNIFCCEVFHAPYRLSLGFPEPTKGKLAEPKKAEGALLAAKLSMPHQDSFFAFLNLAVEHGSKIEQ